MEGARPVKEGLAELTKPEQVGPVEGAGPKKKKWPEEGMWLGEREGPLEGVWPERPAREV